MPTLQWNEDLVLAVPAMDETHIEFVDLLAEVECAADPDLPARWDALVAHTDAHFAREDAWMKATGFSASNCHSSQHQFVLQVLRHGSEKAKEGDLGPARQMAAELAVWFPHHAQSMDAALAAHLHATGFDPLTGSVSRPEALPQDTIHGCGGATCTPRDRALESAQSSAAYT